MKAVFTRLDRGRLLALALWLLPVAALLPLGLLWLWQERALSWWLLAMVACSAAGYGLQYWLQRQNRELLASVATGPDPNWPKLADQAWVAVEQLAEEVKPEDWPLNDGGRWWALGQRTLEVVARCYHPAVEQPLLELTVPHTLLIIERASRDLRADVTEHIPLSHRLTIGDLIRTWRWKAFAERLLYLYRAGRFVIDPINALLGEVWGQLRGSAYGEALTEFHRWLLREYVRKVGYYAIDLYSGRLPLSDIESTATLTPSSQADLKQADAMKSEPLRILVLGRANAGKSSLINALFGQVTAATDVLPDTTTEWTPYRLKHDGLDAALIFDAPAYDSAALNGKKLRQAVLEADLLLWVSAVNKPGDRDGERKALDQVRGWQKERANLHPAPLLVAVSHIDQLHPAKEWQPPYDLQNPNGPKASNIQAAVMAVATDLDVSIDAVIPVCLTEGRIYNVDDALWAALLDRQDEAGKVRFLRCLRQQKQRENWTLLRQQLTNTGRWLLKWPGKALG